MGMTFDDLRDKLFLTLCGLLLMGLGWLVNDAMESVSKDEVEKLILQAQETSPYTREKEALSRSIQYLYEETGKVGKMQEKLQEVTMSNNEKIWRELSMIRIELERMRKYEARREHEESPMHEIPKVDQEN